jgi:hypothetical protein
MKSKNNDVWLKVASDLHSALKLIRGRPAYIDYALEVYESFLETSKQTNSHA